MEPSGTAPGEPPAASSAKRPLDAVSEAADGAPASPEPSIPKKKRRTFTPPVSIELDERASARKERMRSRQKQAEEKRRRLEQEQLEREQAEEAKRAIRRSKLAERRKAEAKKRKEKEALKSTKAMDKIRQKGEKTVKQLELWLSRRIEALQKERQKLDSQIQKIDEDCAAKVAAVEASRYPIPDELLSLEPAPTPPLAERPPPVKKLVIAPELSTDAIIAWDFFRQFGPALSLAPFPLDDFLDMLNHTARPSLLFPEIARAAARLLLEDASSAWISPQDRTHAATIVPKRIAAPMVDLHTWPALLRSLLPSTRAYAVLAAPKADAAPATPGAVRKAPQGGDLRSWAGEALPSALAALGKVEPHALSAAQKLAVLRCLVEAMYDTQRIKGIVAENVEMRLQISARRAEEEKAERKAERSLKARLQDQAVEELLAERGEENEAENEAENDAEAGEGAAPAENKAKKGPSKPPSSAVAPRVEELLLAEKLGCRYKVCAMPAPEPLSSDEEEEDEETLMLKLTRREMLERRSKNEARKQERRRRAEAQELHDDAKEALERALEARNIRALKDAVKYAASCGLEGEVGEGELVYEAWSTPELYAARKALLDLEERRVRAERHRRYERELDSIGVRVEPFGEDRDGRQYFYIEEKLFVLEPSPSPSSILLQDGTYRQRAGLDGAGEAAAAAPGLSVERYAPERYGVSWFIYDSEADFLQLIQCLDERGARERALKENLQRAFDVKTLVAHVAANEAEKVEWLSEGHEHLGRRVRRRFGRQGVMDGTIVGWLPEEQNEGMELWHIQHDDGDNEDLDMSEVREALELYAEAHPDESAEDQRSKATPSKAQASPDAAPAAQGDALDDRPFLKYRNKKRRGAPRDAVSGVGLNALAEGVLEAERSRVLPVLLERNAAWASRGGDRRFWVDTLESCTMLNAVQQAVLRLEEVVHGLQLKEDLKDETDEMEELLEAGWLFDEDAHDWIGRRLRRFYADGSGGFLASNAAVMAARPPQEEGGATAFRIVHDDGEPEEVTEEECGHAIGFYDEDLEDPPEAEKQRIASEKGEQEDKESEEESQESEEDSMDADDDEDDEDYEDTRGGRRGPRRAARAASGGRRAREVKQEAVAVSEYLWPSFSYRRMWIKAVTESETIAEVAVAWAAFLDHAVDFGAAYRPIDATAARASRSQRKKQRAKADAAPSASAQWH